MKTLKNNELCAIIPVYNESEQVTNIINEVISIGAMPIVVNDGSTDKTFEICKNRDDIILINHKKNKGYIEALNSGFRCDAVKDYEYVVTIDADGQLPVKYLLDFISTARNNKYDLVVGNRNYKNRISEILTSNLLNYFIKIKDPFCGLKLYKYSSINKFLPFDTMNLIGAELLIKSHKYNLNIFHYPIYVNKRRDKSRFGNFLVGEFKIIFALIRIILNYSRF